MEIIKLSEQDITKVVMDICKKAINESGSIKDNGFKMRDKKRNRKSDKSGILNWLKDPKLNCAEIARKLWPKDKEESRRSYFYKCRDNKSYTIGKGKKKTTRKYDFSDAEYKRLDSIMRSGFKS